MSNIEYKYQRIKLIVIMKDKTKYNFTTEENSINVTVWIYDLDDRFLTVYNENGARIRFPLNSIEMFYELPKLETRDKSTLRINEIDKNVFEVNDFIKHNGNSI